MHPRTGRKKHPSAVAVVVPRVRRAAVAQDVQELVTALVTLLTRHSDPKLTQSQLEAEWPAIKQTLSLRITAEEATRYPLYARALKRAANAKAVPGSYAPETILAVQVPWNYCSGGL